MINDFGINTDWLAILNFVVAPFANVKTQNISDFQLNFSGIYLNLSMIHTEKILLRVKQLVHLTEPSATVILYGSYARGEQTKQSDFDLLILVDSDKISYSDEQRIKYLLYDLELLCMTG